MPELLFFSTWLDNHFQKAFRKLPKKQQQKREDQLASFLESLQSCEHPATDPSLSAWRPTSYQGVTDIPRGGRLVEYRFPGLMRVVACYFETDGPSPPQRIILLTATLTHDHNRMKRQIRRHRGEIQDLDQSDQP